MASTPYPLPRQTRESSILVGNGTVGPYGPTTFKVFDVEDIEIWAKASGADFFSEVSSADYTVTKTSGLGFDTVSVTFDSSVPGTTSFILQARRTAERSIAVTKAGAINANQLEKELSKLATTHSELRRDLDRTVQTDPGVDPLKIVPGGSGKLPIYDAAGNLIDSGKSIADIVFDAGAGDVVGPVISGLDRIATFADTTGKRIKDSGTAIADLLARAGGTMTGALTLNADPSAAMHAATKQYVDALIGAQDAMVFKGVIDCSANPNYVSADRGWTYRVSVAGIIGGGSGPNVEAGDLLICLTDGTSSGNHATVGANWAIIQANLDGAVLSTRSVATQHSLTGGGNLSADRTLSLVNDTAAPGNNKVYGTDGSGARGWKADSAGGGMTAYGPQAATSGTSVSLTGIAANANLLVVVFDNISSNGASRLALQLGDSGGIETTGYVTSGSDGGATARFPIGISDNASQTVSGLVTLVRKPGTNTWMISSVVGRDGTTFLGSAGGIKTLTGTLDRVAVTWANGTDAFDGAGTFSVLALF